MHRFLALRRVRAAPLRTIGPLVAAWGAVGVAVSQGFPMRTFATDADDPHSISKRFGQPQSTHFAQALREIRAGRKTSHWSWFTWPTPPYYRNGVEAGSSTNKYYALRSVEACRAYLEHKEGSMDLRSNYITMMEAVAEQLEQGVTCLELAGPLDDPKLRSSVKFFEYSTREYDDEVNAVCLRVLRLLNEAPQSGQPKL
eukprot:Hpha_TRINITY_DN16328_c4_g1::TRINITY_DN16328_c4_g1_i1::g.61666::m.61666